MTAVSTIPIKNLYYMLAYAFRDLKEMRYKDIGSEKFESAADMLAVILCRGVSKQIKRGLLRQYITSEESLSSPRGKIVIGESIKTQSIRKRQLVCTYDEFTVNAYMNRIIKTTMMKLLRIDIPKQRKKDIRKLLVFFDDVAVLDEYRINWKLQYDRNNQTYRMLIGICRLVLKWLLQSSQARTTRMIDFDEEHRERLYEKFVLGYFGQEHRELKPRSPYLSWQLDNDYDIHLPMMHPDIVLTDEQTKKTLIIDTKHYANVMGSRAEGAKKKVSSDNLYQIFTYVKNWRIKGDETVSGMLLYAKTTETLLPNDTYQMSGNEIHVRTLDLDRDFVDIKSELDSIAELVKS